MKLAVLGGSGASTPELLDAVASWSEAGQRPVLEVVLQGRDPAKLALVADACRQRAARAGDGVVVHAETSLERALDGADFVLIQVRIGGLNARLFDETFPRAFGLPGEETMGPGGFANAMRTVPALAPLWDALLAHASGAFIINLTNPSGIVSQAATAYTGLRIVSVCDGPTAFIDGVAAATGRAWADVVTGYAGLNHVGFWADAGVDVLESALGATKGVESEDIASLGALPTPYLRFYLHPDRELAKQQATGESRAQQLQRMEADMLAQYSAGVDPESQTRRGAVWYALTIVPLIDAVIRGSADATVLGLPNSGAVDWAPSEAMVELPTRVAAGGHLERLPAATFSDATVALLKAHAAYEDATARALTGASSRDDVVARRGVLVAALAQNPLVEDEALAMRLVDHILAHSPT